jgi:ABC-type phosphate/phosphonate transport system substrate-binding protein
MYNAGPRAEAAWRALFTRVFADAGLDVAIIQHSFPKPIDALWSEPELCCAFMCGWPFVRSTEGQQPIVAPVPSPSRYEGLPRYCSDFVVRESSGWNSLEATFGHRFGWMSRNSQSGFNAPRAYLSGLVTSARAALFSEVRGPLGAPMATLAALLDDTVDVVAIDGFWLDLLRYHHPEKWQGLRVIASTDWTPIPLLVAAQGIDPGVVASLREFLCGIDAGATYKPLLREALVARFVTPDLAAYPVLEAMAREAEGRGYPHIA